MRKGELNMLTLGKNPIKFHLRKDYKDELQTRPVTWGYGGLSAFTYYRTYARKKDNGKLETWQECIIRVIEGMFSILKTHSITSGHSWDEKRAHKLAEEAADRLFQFKWTPPGRGLWMMGTPFVYEKGGAALNNCGFVSTENIDAELSKPFAFLMDMSMVGVGVGFDTKGAGKIAAVEPEGDAELITVEDSREGWVELIACLIDSYLEEGSAPVEPDVSLVRPYGAPIVGFGGVASGPEPLVQGFNAIRDILHTRAHSKNPLLTSVDITDIMNIIGKIVVAGNVRRTAEIAFGEPDDEEFANMKNWEQFGVETGSIAPPELAEVNSEDYAEYNSNWDSRAKIAKKYSDYQWAYKFGGWRWASNNSIFAKLGMDYTKVSKKVASNGEPGFAWLENMQAYGRMKDPADHKDHRVRGGNPCLEQSLEPYELCCLVETYPAKHDDYWDFQRTLKFAYLYAKTVTLVPTHWRETNDVIKRNRRIGTSQSGIQEAILRFGRRKYLEEFCDQAYNYINYLDKKYSEWLGVPLSIKKTSVKPSGTVSLVVGALPGIHYAESESYYRLVRISNTSELLPILEAAGYKIEPAVSDPLRTSVVYFPVVHDIGTVSKKDVSIWEQFANAVDLQHYWADNQVSITITFSEREKDQIARALSCFDTRLKGVSLLPISDHGYAQAPYTPAPREEIEAYAATLLPLDFSSLTAEGENADSNKFCDSSGCEI
jgi:ribonucleoside-triphosphate reductase (thioredoxin)